MTYSNLEPGNLIWTAPTEYDGMDPGTLYWLIRNFLLSFEMGI